MKTHLGKKTLVLGLVNILIFATEEPNPDADFVVHLVIKGQMTAIYVLLRPELRQFIDNMADIFEIVFFTHEDEDYSNAVLDQIDPERVTAARLYKDSCSISEGQYVKDIR